jgi:hypothetical protein
MRYRDGTNIRIGDIVQLEDGRTAEVVALIDDGEYSRACPKQDWSMFQTGLLVKVAGGGIEHFAQPNSHFSFIEHPKEKGRLRKWWEQPSRPGDRVTSGLLGLWAGLWIGGIGRVIYETPVSFMEVAVFALCGALVMFILGITFPKVSRFVTVPFSFFGVGSGGST